MYRVKAASSTDKTAGSASAGDEDYLENNAAFLIRTAVVATGVAGLAVLVRSLRLFSRFEHARQIPNEFFRKHVQLRGKVAYLTADGRLRVIHAPIFRSPLNFILRRKESPSGDGVAGKLSLSLAGVEITEPGKNWLRQQLLWRPIWFTLVRRLNEDDIQVEVIGKKGRILSRKYSVNQELVRRGLGRVPSLDDYTHDLALKTNAEYSRLINALIISEKYADHRGVGMWRRRTLLEALLSYPSQIKDRLENTSLYRLVQLLGSGFKQLASAGYSASTGAARMFGSAVSEYRKLSKAS